MGPSDRATNIATLAPPWLDHVVVNTRDRLDEALSLYRRLGFTITPRGFHTLGSANHLAVFATDYLELIGIPPGATGRRDLLDWPAGLNGLVWGTEDAASLPHMIRGAGLDVSDFGEFSRPVDLPEGPRDATFRTVRLPAGTTAAGRLYWCQHLTRDLVWRDEWRRHPNGALGVAGMVIVANDPDRLGGLLRLLFGDLVQPIAGGVRLPVGLAYVDVITSAALRDRYGAACGADARDESMAALVLNCAGLSQAQAGLQVDGLIRTDNRVVVPARAALDTILEFRTIV